MCMRQRVYRRADGMWRTECTCSVWADFFVWGNALAFANVHARHARRMAQR